MRFKVGDKVVVREWDDMKREFGSDERGILTPVIFTSEMKTFCGRILTIKDAFDGAKHYTVEGRRFRFSEESLMPFEFSKSDLKDGMLCQMRDGEKMIWLYGKMRGIDSFCRVTEEIQKEKEISCSDIVKVGYPSPYAYTLEEMLQMDFGKVIWIRKEEPTVKEFSMDEIIEILKEKFPDVDEFKINTNE